MIGNYTLNVAMMLDVASISYTPLIVEYRQKIRFVYSRTKKGEAEKHNAEHYATQTAQVKS